MISFVFKSLIYDPLYNGLIFLIGIIPTHDVGVAVILLTLVARIILYPLSKRAVAAQMAMKSVTPDIEALKKKHEKDREAQSKAIFALYKERNIKPFSGIALLLVQFPILIGLYWVFSRGGLPNVDASLLYSFVHVPVAINMNFLGIINMSGHSFVLALTAAITQFLYTRLSMGPASTIDADPLESTLSGDMAKTFDVQARYVLPVMIGGIAYSIGAAAPLYWTAGNLFMLAQEYASGRRFDFKK